MCIRFASRKPFEGASSLRCILDCRVLESWVGGSLQWIHSQHGFLVGLAKMNNNRQQKIETCHMPGDCTSILSSLSQIPQNNSHRVRNYREFMATFSCLHPTHNRGIIVGSSLLPLLRVPHRLWGCPCMWVGVTQFCEHMSNEAC